MSYSKQIDLYIDKSAAFAQPILHHFRAIVHEVCPNVEEKIKWGFPHFDYKNQMMCSMASFKKHCAITFWKASLMKDAEVLVGKAKSEEAMGHLGKITSLQDLPNKKALKAYIKNAMQLNDVGVKLPAKQKLKTNFEVPDYFIDLLSQNKIAYQKFEAFSPSHQKEYVQWITEAKTEVTRNKRMATAIDWISEGKDRNWKYK